MSTLRLGPGVTIVVQTTVDSGDSLDPGPTLNGQASWSDLKGCRFFDEMVAKLPELQAQWDAQAAVPEAEAIVDSTVSEESTHG